ncbi:hypothetical protein HK102_012694 [Quaeritorhiza haematococci]|nr:hypothetical protein HK102_012694 [Quaeritorhiza haematococci]
MQDVMGAINILYIFLHKLAFGVDAHPFDKFRARTKKAGELEALLDEDSDEDDEDDVDGIEVGVVDDVTEMDL